jgi:PAS domain S-box-containing protein
MVEQSDVPVSNEKNLESPSGLGDNNPAEKIEPIQPPRVGEFDLFDNPERFKRMMEGVSDGIILIENERVVYVNERASQIFRYSQEELGTVKIEDLAAPEDAKRVKRLYAKARGSSTPSELKYWIVRKDGSRGFIHNRYTFANQDGDASSCTIFITDLTERVEGEREMQAIATVATALRQAQTRTEMLPVILDQVLTLMKAEGAAIVVPDPVTGEMVVEIARGRWQDWTGKLLPPGNGISLRVIASGEPFLKSGADHPGICASHLAAGVDSAACLPLLSNDQPSGALWVGTSGRLTPSDLRTLTAISDVSASALHRAQLLEETQRRLERLAALRSIDMTITASLDLKVILDILLQQVIAHLMVDAAAVLLYKRHTLELEYATGHGFRGKDISHSILPRIEELPGQAAMERRILHYPRLTEELAQSDRGMLMKAEGFESYLAAPLVSKGEVVGVLELYCRSPLYPDREWMSFLESLAMQAAIAIDNAWMFDRLQRSNTELTLAYDSTLEGWVRTLDLRDKETEGHTQRVTTLTLKLAMTMGIHDAFLAQIRRGALLHDIGKLGIPDSILRKAGPLDEAEWELMHMHPTYAYNLLSPIPYLRPALDIPYCHHEQWDGSGYPRGLKGEEIPLAARIFAVVDVWDALRTDRPYCEAWPDERVQAYLQEQAGRQFDPQVVKAFLKLLDDRIEDEPD